MTDNGRKWSDCEANARHIDDDGRETVVVCDMPLHETPGETSWHHDPRLDIMWRYADDGSTYDRWAEQEPEIWMTTEERGKR